MARRSARLSSRKSSTPQPVKRASNPHDELHAPRTLPAKLAALHEVDDLPGSFPQSPDDDMTPPTPSKQVRVATPVRADIAGPPKQEMHPQAHHRTTEKKHADARWLGFSNIDTKAETVPEKSSIPRLQMTPSKATGRVETATTPVFQFTFQREQSLELSPAAKKMMEEKRDEAKRVKEQMKTNGDHLIDRSIQQRRIATPKSHRGRYSDVHTQQFQKMDSIAGHASAYRKDPSRLITESQADGRLPASAKSLKRSPSKAELDKNDSTPSKTGYASVVANAVFIKTPDHDDLSSPRKRARREADGDITPRHSPAKPMTQHTPSRLPQLTSPTRSSLARTTSIKSARFGRPSTAVSSSALLAKSPARASIFSSHKIATDETNLLSRTPPKPSAVRSPIVENAEQTHRAEQCSPLLARSAAKVGFSVQRNGTTASFDQPSAPLLAQTPTRAASGRAISTDEAMETRAPSSASTLLGRFSMLRATPVKSILRTPQRLYSDDPAKVAAGTHLATPPQLAHLKHHWRAPATAPVRKHVDFSSSTKAREASKKANISSLFTKPIATNTTAATPLSPITYPTLSDITPLEANSTPHRRKSGGVHDFTFRAGGDIVFAPSTVPTKPHTTSHSPSFTIRAVVEEACKASTAPTTATGSKKRKMEFENAQSVVETAPSPTVTLGSKKRKFDFENEMAENEADSANCDKENMPVEMGRGDGQPAKRLKTSQSPAGPKTQSRAKSVPVEVTKRATTLSAKPKPTFRKFEKKKTGTSISMARLNALAMPKKRG